MLELGGLQEVEFFQGVVVAPLDHVVSTHHVVAHVKRDELQAGPGEVVGESEVQRVAEEVDMRPDRERFDGRVDAMNEDDRGPKTAPNLTPDRGQGHDEEDGGARDEQGELEEGEGEEGLILLEEGEILANFYIHNANFK